MNDLNGFDKEYIKQRVNYYNRLVEKVDLLVDAPSLSQFKLGEKQKTYFFDSFEYTRYYSSKLKARFLFGDITEVPSEPSIVKSRPIEGDVANSVVLNLDKIRHFLFVKDQKSFAEKKDMLVGRSKARQQHRLRFLDMYFNHPMCNIGQVNRDVNLQFLANRMTIGEHLDYKFILCLEGNDVASNLKWVMSSNSLAIMPKPKYETWFMEGTLIPDYHYVLIKDDYSDLEERMKYYIEHQDEALRIIENAHQYIRQFQNKRQEDVISLLVLKKYFEMTNQKI
ncbi:glycosyl transferase family 90 [Paludibacter sp.]|uniref:glycosyl transferase family 90 n=1 Tax=Paludibacter sp. TaxID=1898105 RepID=UPI0025FA88E6|nr:glycosyl transferase family 90 [Paludibacter sp.]